MHLTGHILSPVVNKIMLSHLNKPAHHWNYLLWYCNVAQIVSLRSFLPSQTWSRLEGNLLAGLQQMNHFLHKYKVKYRRDVPVTEGEKLHSKTKLRKPVYIKHVTITVLHKQWSCYGDTMMNHQLMNCGFSIFSGSVRLRNRCCCNLWCRTRCENRIYHEMSLSPTWFSERRFMSHRVPPHGVHPKKTEIWAMKLKLKTTFDISEIWATNINFS